MSDHLIDELEDEAEALAFADLRERRDHPSKHEIGRNLRHSALYWSRQPGYRSRQAAQRETRP